MKRACLSGSIGSTIFIVIIAGVVFKPVAALLVAAMALGGVIAVTEILIGHHITRWAGEDDNA